MLEEFLILCHPLPRYRGGAHITWAMMKMKNIGAHGARNR